MKMLKDILWPVKTGAGSKRALTIEQPLWSITDALTQLQIKNCLIK